jgi:hypothetical protein
MHEVCLSVCSFVGHLTVQVNGLIAQMEEDEKGYSHRKEYVALDKQVQMSPNSLQDTLSVSDYLSTARHRQTKFRFPE